MADVTHTILLSEPEEPRPARRGFLRTLVTAPIAALATHRFLLPGAPAPAEQAVTRDVLLGYAEWLFMERRLLSRELFPDHPEMERMRALSINAATVNFHLPDTGWRSMPQPSTRAARVLDAVGCDWRAG